MATYGKEFSEIYDEVGKDCGDEDSTFQTEIKKKINDVGRSLYEKMNFAFKQREADVTPVASQQYLNMSDLASAWDEDTPVNIFYRGSDNKKVVLECYDDAEWDDEEDLDEGDPYGFHITKKSGAWRLLFTYVPNASFISSYSPLKMEYMTKWVELSADSDIPGIPTSHHQLLIYRTNEVVSIIMGDTENSLNWKRLADKEEGLLKKKQVNRLGRPKRVRPRNYLKSNYRGRNHRDYDN